MEIKISVIICSHNPSKEYLNRTLDGLRSQTLPHDQWELLLVDNASIDIIESRWDVSWHSHGRHVREDELGLTPARLRGIRESKGEILIFVDDDNVLDADYLENAVEISTEWGRLGAWGGQSDPEFQVPPPDWAAPFLGMLAIREVTKEIWSNDPHHLSAQPWGAGMCVRRAVALEYLRIIRENQVRKALDRVGTALGSCGDIDLVQTCPDLGLGFGLFPRLRLVHLIPARRLEEDYLLKIHEGTATSLAILRAVRGLGKPQPPPTLGRRLINFGKVFRMNRLQRLEWQSTQRANRNARKVCKNYGLDD